MTAAAYARVHAQAVMVTRWRGSVRLVTHVGPGTDEVAYVDCPHEHASPEAAERCARQLARRSTGDVR